MVKSNPRDLIVFIANIVPHIATLFSGSAGFRDLAWAAGGAVQPQLQALLASLEGYRIAPENAEAWLVDAAYASAYRLGALQRGERDEVRAVTRGEVVQCLLNCAGYGPAARLQGIYTCTYSDAAAIPAKDLGYAAIAQALGMVGGRYDGTRTATRGELAVMLCRLLER